MTDEPKDKQKVPFGLKAANEPGSRRLQEALKAVRFYQQDNSEGRDRLEIIVDLMRGENGITVEDVVTVTGWPIQIVQSTLEVLVSLVDGGQAYTLVNEKGTRQVFRITGWDKDQPSEI